MRSPECGRESNMHWTFPVLSPCSPPPASAPPDPGAQCQQKVTCQTDTRGNLGKGTPRGPRSTLWTCFLSAQQQRKQGLERGSKWKGEQGPHDWAESKVWGTRSRKSDTRCRVGPWKPIVRNFTLPPRAGIGNVYELFLIEKRAEEMVSAEKTWAPPSQPPWSPIWHWGGGPAGTCWSFLLASSPLCANPCFTFCPSR